MPRRAAANARFATRTSAVTYAELLDRTGKLAGHLADNGIAPATLSRSCCRIRWRGSKAALAIARAGAVSVPISYDATEAEIAYRLTDADCKAVITSAERGDLFARLQTAAPNLKTIIVTDRGTCTAEALATPSSSRTRRNRRRAIRRRCTRRLSFSTRPAPPAAPRACSSRCTACCGSRRRAGRRSPA